MDVRRSDAKRRASRCGGARLAECKPASGVDQSFPPASAHPARDGRYPKLYSRRSAVEREFGCLKPLRAGPLYVRGWLGISLCVDLTVLVELVAPATMRAVSLGS